MHGPYPGELRTRVIDFVEEGGSRREAAEQFDVSVSSAIRWVQRFRENGTFEPMPSGGSTSPLEKYSRQILALISGGFTTAQMAARLGISSKTIESRRQTLFSKLGVQNQSHAIAVAMRSGLLGIGTGTHGDR